MSRKDVRIGDRGQTRDRFRQNRRREGRRAANPACGRTGPAADDDDTPRTAETNRRKRTNPTPKKPRPFQRKGTEGRDCRSPRSGYARLARRHAPNNGNEPTKTNVFAKPNGQSRACASYAMARKRLLKTNHFVKPNAEPNEVRAMPRREMEERNPTISLSRVQSRTKFGLCRGEKWTNEIQRHETARR